MKAPGSPEPKKPVDAAKPVEPTKPVVAPDAPNTRVEVLKAKLGFWQAIWVTILTSGVAVAIPALVDTYKAGIERDIKRAELAKSQLDAHNTFVTQFLDTAVDQDIELRIRFSEYFSHVSADDYIDNWTGYVDSLKERRDSIRRNIDEKEAKLRTLLAMREPGVDDRINIDSLRRGLDWDYAEVGYARRNEDISLPRATARTGERTASQAAADGNQFYRLAVIDPARKGAIDAAVDKMIENRSRYDAVATRTRFPWYFIAVLHQMEAAGDFGRGFDGKSLESEPAGSTAWEDSVVAAVEPRRLNIDPALAGTLGEMLAFMEAFNGTAYANRGIRSPYVWGCTDLYTGGSFVSGRFDPNQRINSCGAVAYLRALEDRGEAALPPVERTAAAAF